MRPEKMARAVLAAANWWNRLMATIWSARARGKSAMAISEGLVDTVSLRLTVSSGTTRSIVSGKTAFTSPTWMVPFLQVIVSVPFVASARISASAAETVTGAASPPGWNESVGRMSRRPSTPFTLIDILAVL